MQVGDRNNFGRCKVVQGATSDVLSDVGSESGSYIESWGDIKGELKGGLSSEFYAVTRYNAADPARSGFRNDSVCKLSGLIEGDLRPEAILITVCFDAYGGVASTIFMMGVVGGSGTR